jgi:hypothetical protein
MVFDQRLPSVNSDDGTWGNILNQFLMLQHYNTGSNNTQNGSHQVVTIQPGTIAANTAPLTFMTGPLMTTAQAGSVEFLTDKLYFTKTTGPTRLIVAAWDDSSTAPSGVAGATGDTFYRDSSGNFVRLPIGSTSQVLTVVSGLPAWQTATGGGGSGLTQQQVMAITTMRI